MTDKNLKPECPTCRSLDPKVRGDIVTPFPLENLTCDDLFHDAPAPTPEPRLGLCDSPDTMGPHEKCDECINWKPLEAGTPETPNIDRCPKCGEYLHDEMGHMCPETPIAAENVKLRQRIEKLLNGSTHNLSEGDMTGIEPHMSGSDTRDTMKEALEVIAGFPDLEAMYAYCKARNIGHNEEEPPYLTMTRIAEYGKKLV